MKANNHYGFTLIEIAIVLTIVGLLIGGIWLTAATVLENKKRSDFASGMLQALINTKALFASTSRIPQQLFPTTQFLYTSLAPGNSNLKRVLRQGLGLSSRSRGPLNAMIIPAASPVPASGPAGNFNNQTAILAALVRSNWVRPGPGNGGAGYIVHPYTTDFTQDSVVFQGNGNTVVIFAFALPSDACVAEALTVGTKGNVNNLKITEIYINGVTNLTLPTTASAAANACNGIGLTNTVEVSITVP